jgi:hypothetical protein
MTLRPFTVAGAVLLVAVTVAAAAASSSKTVTVADLQKTLVPAVARTWSVTPEQAARMLSRPNLDATSVLTEGAAVDIFKGLGVEASTKQPDRPLTTQKLGALVQRFETGFQSASAATRPAGQLPGGVEVCYQAANHGKCVECCKDLGGSASLCAKSCFVINKPSASEPLP